MILIIFAVYTSAFATIINIPADYPTIQQGIDASSAGDTVLVQPGTYVENINFNGHNIVLGSLFFTSGDTSYISQTIIDGNDSGSVVSFTSGEDNRAIISGFTIQNGDSDRGGGISCSNSGPQIRNNILYDNYAIYNGGGIHCDSCNYLVIEENILYLNSAVFNGAGISINNCSQVTIDRNNFNTNFSYDMGGALRIDYSDVVLRGNFIGPGYSQVGGGIDCYYSNLVLNNCIFFRNYSLNGGGIRSTESEIDLGNCVFFQNEASWFGGAINAINSILNITNTICWQDTAILAGQEFSVENSTITMNYSNIQDSLWPGIGNLSVDPLFRDAENGDFHLTSTACGDSVDSPCIDAGDPAIQDFLLDCDWGLGSQLSDMGAYGGGDSLLQAVDDYQSSLPERPTLLQNYPNPFNASTNIEFALQEQSYISIIIYDITGREAKILFEGVRQPGAHTVRWNAGDYPSGVYFARLEAENIEKSIKMILLK
jgi:hypothetical protein